MKLHELTNINTVYLAGPMTGIPEHNFPLFNRIEAALRAEGFDVFNPAETGAPEGWTEEDYMQIDLPEVIKRDAVFFLPGWRNSSGGTKEYAVATWAGKPCYDICPNTLEVTPVQGMVVKDSREIVESEEWLPNTPPPPTESIDEEAHRIVLGDRNADYGHPLDDMSKTAKMWTGVFLPKLKDGVEVTAEEVAMAMVCVKLSREINRPKRDNKVDAIGYTLTLDMIQERRKELAAKAA